MNTIFLKTFHKTQDLMNREESQVNREEGQDLVEYALLISLLGLAGVASFGMIATAINSIFINVSSSL